MRKRRTMSCEKTVFVIVLYSSYEVGNLLTSTDASLLYVPLGLPLFYRAIPCFQLNWC